MDRQTENQLIEIAARWEAICQILEDGKEVSDFMMSFPEVRKVWDLMQCSPIARHWAPDTLHDPDFLKAI